MFFEDPALLVGIPLALFGVMGALIAISAMISYWIKPS